MSGTFAVVARRVETASAPARQRVGLPIVPDGSRRRPLLVRLPDREDEPSRGRCNNGCLRCATEPVELEGQPSVEHRHVVIRHREATLRPDLAARIAELRRRGPASLALLTNGRLLIYEARTRALLRAGLDQVLVKLFGTDAATHDALTREPGSFAQAVRGIEVARAVGLRVHVTFPEPRDAAAERALAQALTGADPMVMPEPEVEAHPSEFRYDVVHLREVARVSASPLWERSYFPMVHVHTGPACNLRCTYCNVHGGDDMRLYRREDVERVIDAAAEHVLAAHRGPGVPTVDFIGGEPTLHPELPALIAHARARGFTQILICTNGIRLLSSGYLDELSAAGLTGVRFSFHDHRPEVAARLGDVGLALGKRYPEVAELLLSRRELTTYFYRILVAENLDVLEDYVRWLGERGGAVQLTFGMPSMRGRLFENRHLYPSLEGLRERVAAAMAVARTYGIEPVIHHAPACLVPDAPERAACLHIDTRQLSVLDGSGAHADFEGDARYGEACGGCAARDAGCHGVPAAYWEADAQAAERWLRPLPHT